MLFYIVLFLFWIQKYAFKDFLLKLYIVHRLEPKYLNVQLVEKQRKK